MAVEIHPLVQDSHDFYTCWMWPEEKHVGPDGEPAIARSNVIAWQAAAGVGRDRLHGEPQAVRVALRLIGAPLLFPELPNAAKVGDGCFR